MLVLLVLLLSEAAGSDVDRCDRMEIGWCREIPSEDPSRLQQFAVDSVSDDVFAASAVALYRFDGRLHRLVDSVPLRSPQSPSRNCSERAPPCSGPTMEPARNDAKILRFIPDKPGRLLYCGSDDDGLCSVFDVADHLRRDVLDAGNVLNRVGGRTDVHGFFSRRGDLYVGAAYDDSQLSVMSALRLGRTEDGRFNITYLSDRTSDGAGSAVATRSTVGVIPGYRPRFSSSYVYGFEHRGFAYFLTVQQNQGLDDSPYTKLVRVCQNDTGFNSYMELELDCRRSVGLLLSVDYGFAVTADLAPVSAELGKALGIANNEMMLFVVFSRSAGGGYSDEVKDEHEFGLCVFSMHAVRQEFTQVQKNCYQGMGDLLPWMYKDVKKCRKLVIYLHF